MSHDSPRVAMIYQHATATADRAIADELDAASGATQKAAKDEKRKKRAFKMKKRGDESDEGSAGVMARVG
jgi:hypothetical protein